MSHHGIQVGESTDVEKPTMFVFVEYIFQEDVHDYLLCAFCCQH